MTFEATGITTDLLNRAAVLSVFDIGWLSPDTAASDDVIDFLYATCERVVDAAGTPRWRLRDDQRGKVLRTVDRATLQAALDHLTARPGDRVQAALERFVQGATVPVAELDEAGLRAELQLERWAGTGTVAGLGADPAGEGELQARLDWLTILDPLRRLLAHGFYGRRDLLQDCREFISRPGQPDGRPAPGSGRPFLIAGVGGSGKSSVLARLILDLADAEDLVAYLSFDRGWLLDGGANAIFTELLHQLAAQWAPGRDAIGDVLRQFQQEPNRPAGSMDIASRVSQSITPVEPKLLEMLAAAVDGPGRLVVVLDTLEELARRDEALSGEVYAFLRDLTSIVPSARVIGAGRALPWAPRAAHAVRRLTGLDEADATALLRSLTGGVRVTEGALREIFALVGGNPLSLRLAADVLNRTGEDPARMIAVTEGNVQGQLYSRLLDHIRDRRVRAVAHPGLVVRRITPGVIRTVLARPCGIAPLDEAAAAQVFAALKHEATLCEPSSDGDEALVHRPDVRAIMLPAIARDRPGITREIHEAAARYYDPGSGGRPAPATDHVARREELYHRLMLGQDRATLDQRWDQSVATELTTVIEEFPPSSQLYLATKVPGLRLDTAARIDAGDYDWQHVTRPDAVRRMERGQVREALALVQERRDSDGRSLLPDLEIEALERLGRMPEALALARAEREQAQRQGDAPRLREFISHEARILERMRRWTAAWDLLAGLAAVDRDRRARAVGTLNDEVRVQHLIVLTSMLRIARNERIPTERLRSILLALAGLVTRGKLPRLRLPDRHVTDLTRETAELAESTPDRVLTARPSLLRDLAAETGEHSPLILRLAQSTLATEPDSVMVSATAGSAVVAGAVAGAVAGVFVGAVAGTTRSWLSAVISGISRSAGRAVTWVAIRLRRSRGTAPAAAGEGAWEAARQYQSASDASQEYVATRGLVSLYLASFLSLRLSIGVLGVALPFILRIGVVIYPPVPYSVSAYYYSALRNILVASLCVLGVLLLTYRGYDQLDSRITNVAGFTTIGVALFPTSNPAFHPAWVGNVHQDLLGMALASQALMALQFTQTGADTGTGLLTDIRRLLHALVFQYTTPHYGGHDKKLARNRIYSACAWAIMTGLVLAVVQNTWPDSVKAQTQWLFWFESASLIAFGFAWLVKGGTLLKDGASPAEAGFDPQSGEASTSRQVGTSM